MDGIQPRDNELFAPEVANMIQKDTLLFKYLSEKTSDKLLSAFVLDPENNISAIPKIIDLLSEHEDKKHLFSIPTIYWKSFSSATLMDMQKYINHNPLEIFNSHSTKTILEISLQSAREREKKDQERSN